MILHTDCKPRMHPSLASLASAAWFRFQAKKREREEEDETWSITFRWRKEMHMPADIFTFCEDLSNHGFEHTAIGMDNRSGTYPVGHRVELKGKSNLSDKKRRILVNLLDDEYRDDIEDFDIEVTTANLRTSKRKVEGGGNGGGAAE